MRSITVPGRWTQKSGGKKMTSANNLPLRDHTKWFPICHTSYTPKKHCNSAHSSLAASCHWYWISALFRLKSLKYKIVDGVHIRKMCLHQHSARWVSLKPRVRCELWPEKCSNCPLISLSVCLSVCHWLYRALNHSLLRQHFAELLAYVVSPWAW